jgi:NAD(P)-dependent dehydrogenase (short-subunit alcohol dehydrogenase family)
MGSLLKDGTSKKVALVTGASSGIGKATVRQFLAGGWTVYGGSRRVDHMADLAALGAKVRALDVTNEASMSDFVHAVLSAEGRIDVLINDAGYGSYGAIEEVPIEEARRQVEVNVFGLARMTQLVLPTMRKNKSGRIVNISSIGGKVYTPFGGWYHATKFAVEGWSDCLRLETKPFGIDVIIIEPGGIKTDWGLIAADHLRRTSGNGPYAKAANKTADTMSKSYSSQQLSDPSVVASTIFKAVTALKPKTRYHCGYMAGATLLMRRKLSDRMLDRVMTSMM